tara:strand:- start:6222 stop:6404 length:183 start_codon:yes stop_codon:yes gene_type:complete
MIRLAILILPLFLLGCTITEPLNNPKLSFGKKCNDDVWSYVWIYNKDKELQANEKDCEKL